MEEYKTTINVYLNGAGVQYHVKEDVETVKKMFELLGYEREFLIFYDVKHRDEIIPMIIINPANCASVEIYESYFARKGK
jgi:hypothetical protein